MLFKRVGGLRVFNGLFLGRVRLCKVRRAREVRPEVRGRCLWLLAGAGTIGEGVGHDRAPVRMVRLLLADGRFLFGFSPLPHELHLLLFGVLPPQQPQRAHHRLQALPALLMRAGQGQHGHDGHLQLG